MFPATWTWTAVETESQNFLANDLVSGALFFVLAVILGPMAFSAIRGVVGGGK